MPLKARNNGCVAVRTFNLIIFDLDGVIIDSARDLVSAAQHSLKQVGSSDPGFAFIGGALAEARETSCCTVSTRTRKTALTKRCRSFATITNGTA